MAQNIRTDRFGNPFQLVGMRDKKGNGFPFGYAELKGQLYKVEVCESKKDGVESWVKITKVSKRAKQSM